MLRKEEPLQLKQLIGKVQQKTSEIDWNEVEKKSSRLKFMLETLQAIKNNNVSKVTKYDQELIEHFVKLLRRLVGAALEAPLKIPLEDLLNANERGRWWIVGSAWIERKVQESQNSNQNAQKIPKFSKKLLLLAKKLRMNTELRRTIFCIITSAEDYCRNLKIIKNFNLKIIKNFI